jgi:hypothetical protein
VILSQGRVELLSGNREKEEGLPESATGPGPVEVEPLRHEQVGTTLEVRHPSQQEAADIDLGDEVDRFQRFTHVLS